MKEQTSRKNALYHLSLSTARKWAREGHITEKEYCNFEEYLREKYNPLLPALSPKDDLTFLENRANVTPKGA